MWKMVREFKEYEHFYPGQGGKMILKTTEGIIWRLIKYICSQDLFTVLQETLLNMHGTKKHLEKRKNKY